MSKKNKFSWFRFLRPTLQRLTGDLRDDSISANDLVVYLVLRSEAALSERGYKLGEVALPISQISHLTGFSRSTVKRCLSSLNQEGYLTRRSTPGKTGMYVMRDIALFNADGQPKNAQWDYVPSEETKMLQELTAFERGERDEPPKGVHVQNLHINIQVNNNFYGSQHSGNVSDLQLQSMLSMIENPDTPPNIKKKIFEEYTRLTSDPGLQ